MHIVAADLIVADLATELELTLSDANQYLDILQSEDDEDDWGSDRDLDGFRSTPESIKA